MNLLAALKAVAPAVGEGKLVPTHAYVRYAPGKLCAVRGEMSVTAAVDGAAPDFCVRYDSLMRAMERGEVRLTPHVASNGVTVSAGRSRVTLKGVDPESFPEGFSFEHTGVEVETNDLFKSSLTDLSKFTAGGDGHIWQMGVHFGERFAFASGPFAMAMRERGLPFDITIPPWASKFILAQAEPPILQNGTNTFRAKWDGLIMTSTRLIEEAPDYAHTFIDNLPREGGVPVPDNLKETVERLKAYGLKRFRLGNGKIDHTDERLEIEEEVDLDVPRRVWGVDQMLAALEFAETIDLSGGNAVWHGNGYHGAFAGITG